VLRSHTPILAALCLATLAACSFTAQDRQLSEDPAGKTDSEPEGGGSVSIIFENDIIVGNDRNYTSGTAMQWTTNPVESYPDGSGYERAIDGLSFLPFVGDEDREHYLSFSLVQQIYTATNLENPKPPDDDQPYAGLLYLNANVFARDEHSQHDYGLLLGVIGPMSGAEQVQKFAHEVVRTDEPGAWNKQLQNEALINVNYAFHYRLLRGKSRDDGLDWDLTSSLIGNLGTYMTGGSVGLTGRFGFRIPESYSSYGIQSGFTPNPVASDYPSDDWGGFFFASITGIGLAHFAPHGNLWESGRSVDTEPFVGAGSVGASIYYKQFLFSYNFTQQSDLFETQRRATKYGTVSLSYSF